MKFVIINPIDAFLVNQQYLFFVKLKRYKKTMFVNKEHPIKFPMTTKLKSIKLDSNSKRSIKIGNKYMCLSNNAFK